jgi:hypothetical protein
MPFGTRESGRRVGGVGPLPVAPTHAALATDPWFMLPVDAYAVDAEEPVLWDEVEEWDDACMPMRPVIRTRVDEWDVAGDWDNVDVRSLRQLDAPPPPRKAPTPLKPRWPYAVPCMCGHSKSEHQSTGRCRGTVGHAFVNGELQETRCGCTNPTPKETAS